MIKHTDSLSAAASVPMGIVLGMRVRFEDVRGVEASSFYPVGRAR